MLLGELFVLPHGVKADNILNLSGQKWLLFDFLPLFNLRDKLFSVVFFLLLELSLLLLEFFLLDILFLSLNCYLLEINNRSIKCLLEKT